MASEKILDHKKDVVEEIKNKVKNSSSIILVDYRGLSVAELTDLRRKLRQAESDIKIYKNTLTKIAFDDLKIDLDNAYLEGPSAIAFSNDAIQPVKILSEFAKKNKLLELKVGIVDGIVSDKKALAELAKLPSREGLLTMLAGGLMGVVRDLSICLNLLSEQKEKE